MKMKNNLDEMQEQELLKIEHNGCWLAFWLLLISLIVQSIAFGAAQYKIIAGEWIVFIVLALYLAFACLRNGIWDRRLKADPKTNFLISLIAGVVFGLIESGDFNPSIKLCVAICRALGVTLNDLFWEEENNEEA